MLIVIVVFYAGLLLYFITGPSLEDIDNLRKVARWVLIFAVVASGMMIFLGLPVFSLGSVDEETGSPPEMDEEEVMLEEYLGLGDEEAREETDDDAPADDEDTEEGHA